MEVLSVIARSAKSDCLMSLSMFCCRQWPKWHFSSIEVGCLWNQIKCLICWSIKGNKVGGRAGRHVRRGAAKDWGAGLVWSKGELFALYSFLRRGRGEGGADHFSWVSSDRTHGNSSKLRQGRFRLDVRKHFFTERVVKHWNRLPREVLSALSLSVLKRHLDNALNNML